VKDERCNWKFPNGTRCRRKKGHEGSHRVLGKFKGKPLVIEMDEPAVFGPDRRGRRVH